MYYRVAVQFPVSCMRDVLSAIEREGERKEFFFCRFTRNANQRDNSRGQPEEADTPEGEKYTGKNILENYTRVSERDS